MRIDAPTAEPPSQDLLGVYHTPLRWSELFFLIVMAAFFGLLIWLSLRATPITLVPILLVLGLVGHILITNTVDTYTTVRRRILVYANGLIEQRPHHRRLFSWQDVAFLWNTSYRIQNIGGHTLRLQLHSGQHLAIHDLGKIGAPSTSSPSAASRRLTIDELGRLIEAMVMPRLTAEALAQYCQEAAVSFMHFFVDTTGIIQAQQTLPWADIEEIWIDTEDQIAIRYAGSTQERVLVPLLELPNQPVLIALLRRYHGDRYQITHQVPATTD